MRRVCSSWTAGNRAAAFFSASVDDRRRPIDRAAAGLSSPNTRPAWKKFVDARVEARSAAMPLRGCATLSLPPALLPSVTDSAWFGSPAAFDEDAALTALETAYQQQVRERRKKTESTT